MSIGTPVTYRRHDGLFSRVLQFSGQVVACQQVELVPGVRVERFQIQGNHGELVSARKEELSERKNAERVTWRNN